MEYFDTILDALKEMGLDIVLTACFVFAGVVYVYRVLRGKGQEDD